MTTDPWDAVDDIEIEPVFVRPDYSKRTELLFTDSDPDGTARMWAKIREDRLARQASLLAEAEDHGKADEFAVVVTAEAEEFDEPIKPLATVVGLAHKNGWDIVSLAHSQAFEKGKPVKTGARAGQMNPDKHHECQWVHLSKAGVGRIAVYYSIINDVPRGDTVTRRFNGERYSARDLNAIIKGTYNAND